MKETMYRDPVIIKNDILNIEIIPFGDELACSMYWSVNESGEFTYSMTDIADETGFSETEVSVEVRSHCHAYSETSTCKCGAPQEFYSRAGYTRALRSKKEWICDCCLARSS